jgi:hypothetical protein
MSYAGSKHGLAAAGLTLLLSTALGCVSLPHAAAGPAPRSQMALPAATPVRAAVVDTRGCDPAGKAVVIVERDATGRPSRWRYFAPARRGHHGPRALTCEAADRNGDGKVDTRYFYGAGGRLVLEQRDMDFDGQAEFVADYSQFPTRARHERTQN